MPPSLLHGPLSQVLLTQPAGDAQITIAQRIKLSGAVVVSTPQVGTSLPCNWTRLMLCDCLREHRQMLTSP